MNRWARDSLHRCICGATKPDYHTDWGTLSGHRWSCGRASGMTTLGVVAMDALTGALVWQNTAEHTQQIEIGDFLDDSPTPHVAVGARTYGNPETSEPRLWAQVHGSMRPAGS